MAVCSSRTHKIASAVLRVVLIFAIVYSGLGLGFHVLWKEAAANCRQVREARGEFVEPEVFAGALALVFDVTYWPAYVAANIYHDGTPFATPCTP